MLNGAFSSIQTKFRSLFSEVPTSILLEASSACQLKCPSCPTAAGLVNKYIGSSYLSFESFKSVVDQNPWISGIELSNYGEIFLNKDLAKIIRYAHKRCVTLTARNGVNLNHVSEEMCHDLVKYRFAALTCSIDGVTQDTYSKYRVKGNVEQVFHNIRRINWYKQKYDTELPYLNWQYIVFKHNISEVKEAKVMARELDMRITFKKSWDSSLSPSQLQIDEYSHHINFPTDESIERVCTQLWKNPQINYDGKLLGCCVNYWGHFGKPKNWRLKNLIYGDKISKVKKSLLGKASMPGDSPCVSCDVYHKYKNSGKWNFKPNHNLIYTLAHNVFYNLGGGRYSNFIRRDLHVPFPLAIVNMWKHIFWIFIYWNYRRRSAAITC